MAEVKQHDLHTIASSSVADVLVTLKSRDEGLRLDEVQERQKVYGRNVIATTAAAPWWLQLLRSFLFPFNAVLVAIALISVLSDVFLASAIHAADGPDVSQHRSATLVMLGTMILLSSLIRFWQEYRSNSAVQKLGSMIKTTSLVRRQSVGDTEIALSELVPGDIVLLAAGDLIPADCRILSSKDLFVSQSLLTGESMPVEKHAETRRQNPAELSSELELDTMCFMGTTVASGTAHALIVNTGNQTLLAALGASLAKTPEPSAFDKGVNNVSFVLMRFMLVMVPLVFIINGLTKHEWLEALLFAMSVAVGLTPEMLPMIVTTNLARGAVVMSKQRVIVKRLAALQNIGAMDILCTDKTGTLTLDKIVLKRHLNVYGEEDDEVLQWAYLNSLHQTGLRNLLDKAVLEHQDQFRVLGLDKAFEKVDEIPFDFNRRRLSVILRRPNGKQLLICKGAVEEMLGVCTRAFDPGEDHRLQIENDQMLELNAELRQKILKTSEELNKQGLRVLIIAVREFEERALNYSVQDEKELVLTGFIGFLDPPKPSAAESIAALQKLGVSVKVLTGDNEIVTQTICGQVGISGTEFLLGSNLESMSDEDLAARIDNVNIFAKLSPLQKARIIKLLQSRGHCVGFLGDGINDAAALSQADVGISVDSAVDVARESAELILLDKDLMVLRNAVLSGRQTFGNIMKYIKMAASSNFGNMFSVVGASALLPFLPMQPVQILVQNLLYDFSQTGIPWDNMDEEYLQEPRKWDTGGLVRFMLWIGPLSSVFDYATFAVLYFLLSASTPATQSLFQSGWFVESLLSQTLIVHLIRTRKIPFIQSRASTPVVLVSSGVMLLGLALPFSPFAQSMGMVPLPATYFVYLTGILLGYGLLVSLVKRWYISKFQSWL